MPNPDPPSPLKKLGCALLAVGLLFILRWALNLETPLQNGKLIQLVNNQKQIFLAAFTMANDGLDSRDPRLGWPGDLSVSGEEPITSLHEYVSRLEKLGYLKKEDIGRIFAAPKARSGFPTGDFDLTNSIFKVYKVRESDVANVLFSATRNYTFRKGLDPKVAPLGAKGFTILRKGGDAIPFYNRQSALNQNLGLMPGSTTQESPGTETPDSILSM